MRLHLHRGASREHICSGTWADPETGELQRGRVTVRSTTCTSCSTRVVVITRAGRTWRRTYPPLTFDPAATPWVEQ